MFTKEAWQDKVKELITAAKERDFRIHQQFTETGFCTVLIPDGAHPIEIGRMKIWLLQTGACKGKQGTLEIGLFDIWLVAYF